MPTELEAAESLENWSGDRSSSRLNRLFEIVAALCEEAGCSCLAQRLANSSVSCIAETCSCGAFSDGGKRRTIANLLPKLAPAMRALIQLGYYDLALATVEMALTLEPTLDLDLARAYLHVVLGDTQEASGIYFKVLKRIGNIPPGELDKLAALAQSHASEEDISELLCLLKNYSAA